MYQALLHLDVSGTCMHFNGKTELTLAERNDVLTFIPPQGMRFCFNRGEKGSFEAEVKKTLYSADSERPEMIVYLKLPTDEQAILLTFSKMGRNIELGPRWTVSEV